MTHRCCGPALLLAILFSLATQPERSLAQPTAGGQPDPPAAAADPPATIAVTVPEVWKSPPKGPLAIDDGVVWYRAVVVPPAGWEGRPLALFVEGVDDARQVFLNGQPIGVLGTFPPEFRSGLGQSHRLTIDADLLLPGEPNVVAIRVYHYHGRRGFNVAAPVLFGGDQAIALRGRWEAIAEDNADVGRLSARYQVDEASWFHQTIPAGQAERDLQRLVDDLGPLTPQQSLEKMEVAEDLAIDLVLAEPAIGQPLSLKWDSRGRLWVVEYLQYPDPAGLTAVSRDQFLRTVWDRLPQPPPHHFPGADRISVHEDSDGDGVYDRHHVFVDGLSLVTSIALDRDGAWVLNPPYLLFYPDADGDAVADGDPIVHLEGFGMEDSHSLVNSLRWGPDGWLYATQGSTVSGEVRRYGSDDRPVRSVGQLVWRYHPPSGRYEIFSEGGGNAFGVEIDSRGQLFSGHNGGDTRGFHYLPGGYFRKGFGKHGELSNPYAFGFLEAMAHHRAERFTHTFVIQESESLPSSYRGQLLGIEPLQGRVVRSQMRADGSSFSTEDVGFALQNGGDDWFRPVDIQEGPDGALYIADFYEQRIDHASHAQGRIDRDSGRVYRLRAADGGGDLNLPAADDAAGWVQRLSSPIRWQRQMAVRRVVELADPTTYLALQQMLFSEQPDVALGALWSLAQLDQLDEQQLLMLLEHPLAAVRQWTARLIGDRPQVSAELAAGLAALAVRETASPDQPPAGSSRQQLSASQDQTQEQAQEQVRVQLAATARRLPLDQALPLLQPLIAAAPTAEDNRLPLMVWWAMEAKISEDSAAFLRWWTQSNRWDSAMVRQTLAGRVMQRYASAPARQDLLACAALLQAAPDRQAADILLAGFEAAYRGRSLAGLPDELVAAMAQAGGGSLPLRVRRGDPQAIDQVLATVADGNQQLDQRIASIELLGDVRPPAALGALLPLATKQQTAEPLRLATLAALQGFDSDSVATAVLQRLGDFSPDSRKAALSLLASRARWSEQLLNQIDRGELAAKDVPEAMVRKIHLHRDPAIRERVKQHWGELRGATTAQMEADIDRYLQLIPSGIGNPTVGKQLFAQHCGTCHQMFGSGGQSGPDLTSYQRHDVRGMMVQIVNPDLEIREGYENYLVLTDDGRAINGLLADSDQQVVVIRDAASQTRVIARDQILQMAAVPQSLMPTGLLNPLTDQQIRDLMAYLRSTQPIP